MAHLAITHRKKEHSYNDIYKEKSFGKLSLRSPDCIVMKNQTIVMWHCYGQSSKVQESKRWIIHTERTSYLIQQKRFNELSNKWKADTDGYSTSFHKSIHPAYLQIIAMGKEVVPMILKELKQQPNHWFVALKTLTGKNPVPPEHMGNIKKMTEAWILWGENAKLL